MSEPETCQRCRLPIVGTRYRLRGESDMVGTRSLEVTLCEPCMGSLFRWLSRRDRRRGSGKREQEAGDGSRTPRGPKSSRQSPYVAELDREEGWIHLRLKLFVAAAVVLTVVCATVAMIVPLMNY